jgi:hypothetical protein
LLRKHDRSEVSVYGPALSGSLPEAIAQRNQRQRIAGLADEIELVKQVVAQIERKRRDADSRVDALARLRAAMTPDERTTLRWVLDTKEAALLRDLGRLQTAAAFTASFLELRNHELEQSLAGSAPDSAPPNTFSHLAKNERAKNERSNDGHACTTP